MLGYDSAQELIAATDGSLSFADTRECTALLRQLLTVGEVRNAEHELRRKDGGRVVVLINARAHVDYVGLPLGFEGTVSNITERKRAERLVFEEKERAQVTLQSIGEAVIRTDAEGRIDYMNPTAESLTGWTLFESRGRPIDTVLRVVDEATRKEATSPLLRCLREGCRHRLRNIPCCRVEAARKWRSTAPWRPSAIARARRSAPSRCSATSRESAG